MDSDGMVNAWMKKGTTKTAITTAPATARIVARQSPTEMFSPHDIKIGIQCRAPKGASDFEMLSVSLKRYPDTNLNSLLRVWVFSYEPGFFRNWLRHDYAAPPSF